MKHKLLASLLSISLISPAQSGVFGSIGKAIGHVADNFVDNAVKKVDDVAAKVDGQSAKAIPSPDSARAVKPPSNEELVDIFSGSNYSRHLLDPDYFDGLTIGLKNADTSFNQIGFDNFWAWYISLRISSHAAINAWREDFSEDVNQGLERENLSEEVPITDKNGLPTFAYLINPAFSEVINQPDDSAYISNMGSMFNLLTISGRAGGLHPMEILDFERLKGHELTDYVLFDAELSAMLSERNQLHEFEGITEHYINSSEQLFLDASPRSDIEALMTCATLTYSYDGGSSWVLPGSEQIFDRFCSNTEIDNRLKRADDFFEEQMKDPESPGDIVQLLAVMRSTLHLSSALNYAIFKDKVSYLKHRNLALHYVQKYEITDSEQLRALMQIVALGEVLNGNLLNAAKLIQEQLSFPDQDNSDLAYLMGSLAWVYLQEQDIQKVRQLIAILQSMSHPDSKYFAPFDSKAALIETLIGLEYLLAKLNSA